VDRSDLTFYNDIQRRLEENGNTQIRNLGQLVDELRVIKGSREVDLIQKACNITSRALLNVMKECDPGMFEFEIEAIIYATLLQYGAARPGFPPIVGSGPNSTILHYGINNRQMEAGDLLLMDIGAEYGYYSADITRTIPVNGRFSDDQRTVYQLLLDAQLAAIESLKPGNMIGDGHAAAREVIVDGLLKLGLMTDSSSAWQMKLYMPHQSSHFLGLDVHDVGDDGGFLASAGQDAPDAERKSRVLEPGMVLTIEPGIYFREKGLEQLYKRFGQDTDSSEIAGFIEQVGPIYMKYINIGVRIEDDILITKEGNINLSRYAPKEIEDIEQIMR
jgi:Xaa-Pro aminopeptidase